ncbi:MAG: pirin family protein, partial [Deltaproteobacteria bacterium]|nr:pirin family protein [Deltaproteobacteria bacterium]
ITLRRNTERSRLQRGRQRILLTFHPGEDRGQPADDFGVLASFNEIHLPPAKVSALHPLEEAEIVTYVFKGELAQEDSTGNSGVVHAGEFQHMTVGRGVRHKETNASRTEWAHIFRISLHPWESGLGCVHEQKRFAQAERRNVLCVVAAPDGRKGSLRVLQDALIYSSVLDPGHHLVHELAPGRSAWLHVIYGEVTLQDTILSQGDGAGVTIEPSASLTAQENTEILLIDSVAIHNSGPPNLEKSRG